MGLLIPRRGQPRLGTLKSSTPASCSSPGTSARPLSFYFPVLPSSSWESSSNGCDRTLGGSIRRFSPRRVREGLGLVAVEMEAVNAAQTPQRERSSTGIKPLSCSHQTSRFLPISRVSRMYRSLLYAILVFISFFLMLVFMTYNVRNCTHADCGSRLLRIVIGVFDLGDRRRSWHRKLPVLRIELGRGRKGDGLSLRAVTPHWQLVP